MIETLLHIEQQIPLLLQDRSGWNSLLIDYEKPLVERLWIPYGKYRLYLHYIHPCSIDESLYHPHPSPSAMKIVQGSYLHQIGFGAGSTPPPVTQTILMTTGSSYEMTHPDNWHAIAPIETVLSIMIVGKPWNRWSPKAPYQLKPLSLARQEQLENIWGKKYPK